MLPAEAIILATPLYWYGVSGQLKTFLDRLFCYIAASEPESELFVSGLLDKRLACSSPPRRATRAPRSA